MLIREHKRNFTQNQAIIIWNLRNHVNQPQNQRYPAHTFLATFHINPAFPCFKRLRSPLVPYSAFSPKSSHLLPCSPYEFLTHCSALRGAHYRGEAGFSRSRRKLDEHAVQRSPGIAWKIPCERQRRCWTMAKWRAKRMERGKWSTWEDSKEIAVLQPTAGANAAYFDQRRWEKQS